MSTTNWIITTSSYKSILETSCRRQRSHQRVRVDGRNKQSSRSRLMGGDLHICIAEASFELFVYTLWVNCVVLGHSALASTIFHHTLDAGPHQSKRNGRSQVSHE
jgi:hypothetical protein